MTPTKRCASCRAPILWTRTKATGSAMPVEEREGGNLVIERDLYGENPIAVSVPDGTGTHQSHFVSCPDSAHWRSKR